jgi:hypothetical protein
LKGWPLIIKHLRFFFVDYIGKISNLLEDLEKLDRFAQSVEDELNRIGSKEEGSRVDP